MVLFYFDTFASENERTRSWLDFRGSEVQLDRQNTDIMERERWKSQEEGCWREAVPGKGLELRTRTEGSDIFRCGGGPGGRRSTY